MKPRVARAAKLRAERRAAKMKWIANGARRRAAAKLARYEARGRERRR